MYVAVCRHMHWHALPGQVWKSMPMCRHSSFGVEGSGFRVHDLNNAHCTCTLGNWCHMHTHTWAPLPCANAQLGENSLPPYFPLLPLCSSKKGIAAIIWQYLGEDFQHVAQTSKGQMPNGCAECSPLLAANASWHKLPFLVTKKTSCTQPLACSKVCCAWALALREQSSNN